MKQQNKSKWRKWISVMTLAFVYFIRTFPKVSVWGERIFLTYNFALFLFCLLFVLLGGFAAVYRKAVKCWQSSHTGASQGLSKKSNCLMAASTTAEKQATSQRHQRVPARSQAGARL